MEKSKNVGTIGKVSKLSKRLTSGVCHIPGCFLVCLKRVQLTAPWLNPFTKELSCLLWRVSHNRLAGCNLKTVLCCTADLFTSQHLTEKVLGVGVISLKGQLENTLPFLFCKSSLYQQVAILPKVSKSSRSLLSYSPPFTASMLNISFCVRFPTWHGCTNTNDYGDNWCEL